MPNFDMFPQTDQEIEITITMGGISETISPELLANIFHVPSPMSKTALSNIVQQRRLPRHHAIKLEGDFAHLDGNNILTLFREGGDPFSSVVAVRMNDTRNLHIMTHTDEEAQQIRLREDGVRTILNAPSTRIVSQKFHTHATFFRQGGAKMKMAPHSFQSQFKDPNKCVENWSRENGIDIRSSHWQRGKLVLVFDDVEQARYAIQRRLTLSGQHTGLK